jgi:hypothetical protein
MKSFKNTVILFVFLAFNTFIYSQQRGNMGGSPQSQMMMQPNLKPENMAKIIMYDFEKVVKKLKIKEPSEINFVSKTIGNYNNKINEIKAFNYETFDLVKSLLTKKRDEAKLYNDFSIMKKAQAQANEILAPIREKVINQQKKLNELFKEKLSEKQYKSWLKYQKIKQYELKPKKPQNQQMNSQKGNGQRQGMSRNGGYY